MREWVVWNWSEHCTKSEGCLHKLYMHIIFIDKHRPHTGYDNTNIYQYIQCKVHTASMRMTYSCPTLAWHDGQGEKNPGHGPIQSTAYDIQLTGKWKCDKEKCLIPVTVPLETSPSLDLQTHPRFIKCQLMPWVSPIIFTYSVTCLERPLPWQTTCLDRPHIFSRTYTSI